MNWENIDNFDDQDNKDASFSENKIFTEKMQTEKEDKIKIQLEKYQEPTTNQKRQALTTIVNRFGELLVKNHMEEITETLLVDNCECFFFNFLDGELVIYAIENKHFPELYKGAQIIERKVRETHVDSDRNVVFQICDCRILQSEGTSVINQATFEIFTINDDKIAKYRAGFASFVPAHGSSDPFELTRKDVMLAKVKELNYALADQPNLERVASLLHENAEYKILDWDGERVHTFHKQDLEQRFNNLEEHYTLKCLVPSEVYSDREFVIGTYVYYLESKGINAGKEYVWLSTSVYSFDKDLNIVHINQQGELYPKDEVTIPFEAYSRNKLNEMVSEFLDQLRVNTDLYYNNKVDFNFHVTKFGPLVSPDIGTFHGLKELDEHNSKVKAKVTYEWSKAVDIFVDSHNPSYDVAIAMTCHQGTVHWEGYKHQGVRVNFLSIIRHCFENGKLAKMCQFLCGVPEPIPSPFEDGDFEGVTIKPRRTNE